MYHIISILANNTSPSVQDTSYIKIVITASIPAIVSIIGFILTTRSVKRNFKNEIAKQKNHVHIEKMSTVPYDVLMYMEKAQEGENANILLKYIKDLMNTIYSYGSEKAIILVSNMQKDNYAYNKDKNSVNKYRIMTYYALLATQIKYDVTGISVSPNLWYQMKITDYEKAKNEIKEQNNIIVNELNLNKQFLIE